MKVLCSWVALQSWSTLALPLATRSQQLGVHVNRPQQAFKFQKSRNQNIFSLETFLGDLFAKSFLPQYILKWSMLQKEALSLVKSFTILLAMSLPDKEDNTPVLLLFERQCYTVFTLAFPPQTDKWQLIYIKYNSYQHRQETSITSQVPPLCCYLLQLARSKFPMLCLHLY